MPVTFVNGNGLRPPSDITVVPLTPGAGSDFILGAYHGAEAIGAVTAAFDTNNMALLNQFVGDTGGGLFGRSIGWFALPGNYAGASRDFVLSAGASPLLVAAFAGVDQASPILHVATPVRVLGATSVSITIPAANNPAGSRIVWFGNTAFNYVAPAVVNIGATHVEPTDFGDAVAAIGSVPGTGADVTITFARPAGSTDMLIFAVVLREAVVGGGSEPRGAVNNRLTRQGA